MAQTSASSFSYAQAAKGLSSIPTTHTTSKPSSGIQTPVKEVNNNTDSPTINPQSNSADGSHSNSIANSNATSAANSNVNGGQKQAFPSNGTNNSKSQPLTNGSGSPASPALADSSISTLNREDDISSNHNNSSDSTWENVSQTSNAVNEKAKKEEGNETWAKLPKPVEAPPPTVNIWKKRMQSNPVVKKTNDIVAEPIQSKEQEKSRKYNGRKINNDDKVQPPTINDQESWPTPVTSLVADEERKRTEPEKIQKTEKANVKGKNQWKTIEIDHTVVFQTPFSTNSRRGGRASGRGGRASPTSRNDKRQISPNEVNQDKDTSRPNVNGKDRKVSGEDITRQVNNKAEDQKVSSNSYSKSKNYRRSDVAFGERKDSKVQHENESVAAFNQDDTGSSPKPNGQSEDKRASIVSEPGYSKFNRGGQNGYSNRGRGNTRGRGSHTFQPTASAPTFQPNGYGMIRSPTSGSQQYFQQSNSPRARTPRTNETYPRYWHQIPASIPPINTFVAQSNGAMPEYSPHPMSAPPYSSASEHLARVGQMSLQLRYYFSLENLEKDSYLKKHMDSQGFVLLSLIAEFHRMKSLCHGNLDTLRLVAQGSNDVEYRFGVDGKDRVRHPTLWKNYVLDMAERDENARHDGVEASPNPPISYPILGSGEPMSAHSFSGPMVYPEYPSIPATNLIDYGRFQSPQMSSQPFMTPNFNSMAFRSPQYHNEGGHINGMFPPVLSRKGSSSKGMSNNSPIEQTSQQLNGLHITTDESSAEPLNTSTTNATG